MNIRSNIFEGYGECEVDPLPKVEDRDIFDGYEGPDNPFGDIYFTRHGGSAVLKEGMFVFFDPPLFIDVENPPSLKEGDPVPDGWILEG